MWRFSVERHAKEWAERIRSAGVNVSVLRHRDIVTDQSVWIVEIKGIGK